MSNRRKAEICRKLTLLVLFCTVLFLFLPMINISTFQISYFDIITFSEKITDLFGDDPEYIIMKLIERWRPQQWKLYLIALLPFVEVMVGFLIKNPWSVAATGISILLNNYIGYQVYTRMENVLKSASELSAWISITDKSGMVQSSKLLWISLHALIVVFMAVNLYLYNKMDKKTYSDDTGGIVVPPVLIPPGKPIPNHIHPHNADSGGVPRGFYGAIIQKRYTNQKTDEKAFKLTPGEKLTIGSSLVSCRIQMNNLKEMESCIIWYEEVQGKYMVQPTERLLVFLKSGQPLGKNRCYHLMRGTEIYIKNRSYMFELV